MAAWALPHWQAKSAGGVNMVCLHVVRIRDDGIESLAGRWWDCRGGVEGERTSDALAAGGEGGAVEARLRAGGDGSDVTVDGAGLCNGGGDEGQDEGVGELHAGGWDSSVLACGLWKGNWDSDESCDCDCGGRQTDGSNGAVYRNTRRKGEGRGHRGKGGRRVLVLVLHTLPREGMCKPPPEYMHSTLHCRLDWDWSVDSIWVEWS